MSELIINSPKTYDDLINGVHMKKSSIIFSIFLTNQSELDANVFNEFTNLESLRITKNQLTHLPQNIFANLSLLIKLNISCNKLSSLRINVFSRLSLLKELDMSENCLTALNQDIFVALGDNLEILNISSNQLSKLPLKLFNGLVKLKKLNLSNNQLNEVKSGIFDQQVKLEYLNLKLNNLEIIENNTFAKTQNLNELLLSSNNINILNEDTFSGLVNLKKLDLSNNKIVTLEQSVFNKLTNLLDLHLDTNHLETLNKNIFQKTKKLRYINISNNQLTDLDDATFQNLKGLKFLQLYGNLLTKFNSKLINSIDKKIHIKLLNLSSNKIEKLDDNLFDNLPSLEKLDLSKNKLEELNEDIFVKLINLTELHIDNNNLIHLKGKLFQKLTQLKTLNLNNNQLVALEEGTLNELVVLQDLNLSFNRIKALEYSIFWNLTQLKSLNLEANRLKVLEPALFSNLIKLTKLILSNNQIEALHDGLFDNLKSIKLLEISNNRLAHVEDKVFLNVPSLSNLNLSNNQIFNFAENAFHKSSNLKWLDVSYNTISSFNFVQPLMETTKKFNDSIGLNLKHNGFIKELDMSLLKKLIQFKKIQFDLNKIESFRLERNYNIHNRPTAKNKSSKEMIYLQQDRAEFKSILMDLLADNTFFPFLKSLNEKIIITAKQEFPVIDPKSSDEFYKFFGFSEMIKEIIQNFNSTMSFKGLWYLLCSHEDELFREETLDLLIQTKNSQQEDLFSNELLIQLLKQLHVLEIQSTHKSFEALCERNSEELLNLCIRNQRFSHGIDPDFKQIIGKALENNNQKLVGIIFDYIKSEQLVNFNNNNLITCEQFTQLFEKKWWNVIEKALDCSSLENNFLFTYFDFQEAQDESKQVNDVNKHTYVAIPQDADNDNLIPNENEHPLTLISKSGKANLIKHPTIKKLLELKWNTLPFFYYWIVTFIQLVFTISFSCHVQQQLDSTKQTFVAWSIFNFSLAALFCFSELIQLIYEKFKYFHTLKNILEMIFYFGSLIILSAFAFEKHLVYYGLVSNVSSIVILCGWFVMMLSLEKVSEIGIYIVAFRRSLRKSLKLFPIALCLFMGFYCAFKLKNKADSNFNMFELSAMSLANIDIGKLNMLNQMSASNYLVFFAFIFLMPILLVDLLIGVAIGELRAILEESGLIQIKLKIEFTIRIQHILLKSPLRNLLLFNTYDSNNAGRLSKIKLYMKTLRGQVFKNEYIYSPNSKFNVQKLTSGIEECVRGESEILNKEIIQQNTEINKNNQLIETGHEKTIELEKQILNLNLKMDKLKSIEARLDSIMDIIEKKEKI